MQGQLPVTVVTGSQGGDAWLLESLRATSSDDRVTAIVPKGRRSSRGPGLVPTTERLVRMGQGCACCTVRGDLLTKVRKIVREGQAAHVLIQAPAHADLVTLAKTFTVADDQGKTLSSVASLQSVAVSIDTATFDSELRGKGGRGLVERIELADTIVLRGDDAWLAMGGRGGPRILSALLQVLYLRSADGWPLERALAAPRIHHQWQPDKLILNAGIPEDVARDLEGRGHDVVRQKSRQACKKEPGFFDCFRASVQAVAVVDGEVQGGSDPAKGGWPAGVWTD